MPRHYGREDVYPQGISGDRHKESRDGLDGYAAGVGHDSSEGMMRSDHSAMANCPREVIMKEYSKPYTPLPEDYDDTIRGADRQMEGDSGKMRKGFKPRKA